MIDKQLKIISSNIKAERARNNLTQVDVAKELGMTMQGYNKLENTGNSKPSVMFKLANLFGCEITDFFKNVNSTNSR